MTSHRIAQVWLLLGLGMLLQGCSTYPGEPSGDEPHGVLQLGEGISVWAVDGVRAPTAYGLNLTPGRHKVRVRMEHPIESDEARPYERRDVVLDVEDGVLYLVEREPAEFPPYELTIRQRRFRQAKQVVQPEPTEPGEWPEDDSPAVLDR